VKRISAERRRANQAAHWNARQAAATTPEEVVTVWFDACRMVAKQAANNGQPDAHSKLADHLHDFYKRYAE
jgi:formiminotetrahydrofolate cyclodeaminase